MNFLAAVLSLTLVGLIRSQVVQNNDVDRLRQSTDRFGLSLYQAVAANQNGPSNMFLSPLSVNSALLMTYLGARNQTRDELGKALGINDFVGTNIHHINRAYSAVVDIFRTGSKPDNTGNYKLDLANKFCLAENLTLKQDFVQVLRQYYSSDIVSYDFRGHAEDSRQSINSWVSNITHGKIQNLLSPGMVNPQTMLVLVNAIYFKADWQYQFDKVATTDVKFFTTPDNTKLVKMMSARRRFFHAESETLKAQLVEIPYKSEEISMLVMLPNALDGLAALERSITVASWQSFQDQMDMRMVALMLPKFRLEASYDLVEPLNALGIRSVFTNADLSGIMANADGVGVSGVVHKTFVEVDEEGTEAAAATGIVFSRSAVFAKPDETKEFRADHPFLFAIRHNPTNLIIFMGRVNDPSVSS